MSEHEATLAHGGGRSDHAVTAACGRGRRTRGDSGPTVGRAVTAARAATTYSTTQYSFLLVPLVHPLPPPQARATFLPSFAVHRFSAGSTKIRPIKPGLLFRVPLYSNSFGATDRAWTLRDPACFLARHLGVESGEAASASGRRPGTSGEIQSRRCLEHRNSMGSLPSPTGSSSASIREAHDGGHREVRTGGREERRWAPAAAGRLRLGRRRIGEDGDIAEVEARHVGPTAMWTPCQRNRRQKPADGQSQTVFIVEWLKIPDFAV
ncbi:hypothetical protein BS78_02G050200 [Paspalum vaginatum]|nr:hypothetical protein BS78_02G050200 [Paspalum vaginatum]